MYKVLVFAGTTEGYEICRFLADHKIETKGFVATEYGSKSLTENEFLTVQTGRLDAADMEEVFLQEKPEMVLDATHPYAAEVTVNIRTACENTQTAYYRVLREAGEHEDRAVYVDSVQAATDYLDQTQGNVLLTTGSKELAGFTGMKDYQNRLYARVLSLPNVMKACAELGFEGKHLIGMQGPFSRELNAAMLRQYDCRYLVTKDTGKAGGFQDKIDAARKAYDGLDKAQKDLVTNYPMLTEAEKAYADLVKADQDKAQEVIDLINGIGTVTKDSGDKIDAARKAYDKLTDDQKELVPEDVRKTLTDAEKAYKDLTDPNPPTPPARETYTLTFNTNGGSELPAVEFKAGTKVNLKDYITIRTGFKFLGWYSDPDFRHKVTTVKLDQDITVYAKWSELPKDTNGNTSTGAGVTSQNTGDAGVTLYVGMGLVAVLAGAVIITRKRKEN